MASPDQWCGVGGVQEKQIFTNNHQAQTYDGRVWDLNRLRVWCAVVEAGSVNGAARNLRYAAASVSQHIIALQRTVGFPIYHRVGRGIEITAAGRRLAERATVLFADVDEFSAFVESVRRGPRPQVRIGCFSSAGRAWVPAVLRGVVERFPDLRFDITTNEPLLGTEHRPGDLEIINEPGQDDPHEVAGYHRETLLQDDYLVVLPEAHPLSGYAEVPVALLGDEPLVELGMPGSPTARVIEHATQAAGFTPRYVARADDHYGILAMVAAGIGLTVLPRLALADVPAGLTVRPLVDPTPVRRVVLLVRQDIVHLEHIRLACALVRQQAAAAR